MANLLAQGISPVRLAGVQAVRVVVHVLVKSVGQTLVVGLVVLSIIDNKLKGVLLVVLAISGGLLVQTDGRAQVAGDHLDAVNIDSSRISG